MSNITQAELKETLATYSNLSHQEKKDFLKEMTIALKCGDTIPPNSFDHDFSKKGMMHYLLEYFVNNEAPSDYDTQNAVMVVKGILKVICTSQKLVPLAVNFAVLCAIIKLEETHNFFQSVLEWIGVYLYIHPEQIKLIDSIIFVTGSGTFVQNPTSMEDQMKNKAIELSKYTANQFADYKIVNLPETSAWLDQMNELVREFISSDSPSQESKE